MRIGVPKEIKTHEYRVGLTPASVRELVEHGHEVLVETDAGDAIGLVDAMYESAGARIASDAEEVFAERRADRQGQGAAGERAGAPARGPGPVHLSPSRARPGADRGPAGVGLRRDRLRDRDRRPRRPAAARADERGRRADVDPGRRPFARAGPGRPGRAAAGRARGGARQGPDHRRRRGRHQRRAGGARHGRPRSCCSSARCPGSTSSTASSACSWSPATRPSRSSRRSCARPTWWSARP